MEVEELANIIEHDREDKIKQLEEQLAEAQKNASNNKAATEILTELIQKGEVKQEDNGQITVIRGPNYIGNLHEQTQ